MSASGDFVVGDPSVEVVPPLVDVVPPDHITDVSSSTAQDQMLHEYSQIPPEVPKQLDCIDFNKDGLLVVAASSLQTRYWTGSLWIYDHPDDAPHVEKCVTARMLESTVSCVRFISATEVLTLEDSGRVTVHELLDTAVRSRSLQFKMSSQEHDDLVMAGDLTSDHKYVVTGDGLGCIKVTDVDSLLSEHSYQDAHCDAVTGLSCHPSNSSVFISCSSDTSILTWDTRTSRPASSLLTVPDDGPCDVSWRPQCDCTVAVGWESGSVTLIDVRSPADPLCGYNTHCRQLFRLRWNQQRTSLLASCADDSQVVVVDVDSSTTPLIYKDDRHSDMVRGLAWHPSSGVLYSSGWDKQILQHTVPVL